MNDTMDIVRFYRGEIPSWGRRWLKDIRKYDDMSLEHTHDYIQWLFPIEEPSYFNRNTPKLSDEVIKEFNNDKSLRDKLEQSFIDILAFLGLEMEKFSDGVVIVYKASDYEDKKDRWQTGKNHNLLRITRILQSLQSLGLRSHAIGFYIALMNLVKENPDSFNKISLQYWKDAISSYNMDKVE